MKRRKTELCKKAYWLGNMGKDISNQPGAGLEFQLSDINRVLAPKSSYKDTISKEGRESTTTHINEEACKNSVKS